MEARGVGCCPQHGLMKAPVSISMLIRWTWQEQLGAAPGLGLSVWTRQLGDLGVATAMDAGSADLHLDADRKSAIE